MHSAKLVTDVNTTWESLSPDQRLRNWLQSLPEEDRTLPMCKDIASVLDVVDEQRKDLDQLGTEVREMLEAIHSVSTTGV